jgi:hypothetical protein
VVLFNNFVGKTAKIKMGEIQYFKKERKWNRTRPLLLDNKFNSQDPELSGLSMWFYLTTLSGKQR